MVLTPPTLNRRRTMQPVLAVRNYGHHSAVIYIRKSPQLYSYIIGTWERILVRALWGRDSWTVTRRRSHRVPRAVPCRRVASAARTPIYRHAGASSSMAATDTRPVFIADIAISPSSASASRRNRTVVRSESTYLYLLPLHEYASQVFLSVFFWFFFTQQQHLHSSNYKSRFSLTTNKVLSPPQFKDNVV